jgi:protein-S-isoprenylcysteine O-methyltransferase Ste14
MSQAFDYFQIVILILFLFIFVGRTLYLRFKKGVRPITLGVGKKGLQQIAELAFFVGLLLWMTEVFLFARRGDLLFSGFHVQLIASTAARVAGAVMITAGFVVFIWALLSFGSSWRVGIDARVPGDLVTGGAFALSRNPIFVFVDLYFAGVFLINGTLVFLVFAVLVLVGMHYQILQEETFLTRQYGQAYRAYCARTRRYFGRRN